MQRDPSLIPLSQQHHNGLALCVLTDRELDKEPDAAVIARLARRCIDRYEVELINHFEIEEQVLFPACTSPLVPVLIAEHRELERLVDVLRSSPTAALLRDFTALLRRHIRREENELFESIQKALPRQKLDELGAEIDRRAVRVCF